MALMLKLAVFATMMGLVLVLANGAKPTPITDPAGKLIGPVRWQAGAKIDVYIPLDPLRNDPVTPRTRHLQVQNAVNLWQSALAANKINLTLNSVILDENGKFRLRERPLRM
jgi:hypothetical protein